MVCTRFIWGCETPILRMSPAFGRVSPVDNTRDTHCPHEFETFESNCDDSWDSRKKGLPTAYNICLRDTWFAIRSWASRIPSNKSRWDSPEDQILCGIGLQHESIGYRSLGLLFHQMSRIHLRAGLLRWSHSVRVVS